MEKNIRKGLKRLATSIIFIGIGPVIVHSAFKNMTHAMFYPIFLFGIICMILAIIYIFLGIKAISKSLFN